MNKALAKELLFDVDKIFKKYSITYWLDCGTLLGAVRDKDFITWDKNDIDIGIYEPIFLNYKLWEQIVVEFAQKRIDIITTWGDSVFSCKRNGMVLDVHVVQKNDNEYQIKMKDFIFSFTEEMFNQLDTINFLGKEFNIPNNVEGYLERLYGSNWREPHPEIEIWTSKYAKDISSELSVEYIRQIPIPANEVLQMRQNVQISIIMPTYKRPELLKLGLLSLSNQVKHYRTEVIVLNDYLPDDGTKEICEEYKEKLNIRYIFTGERNIKKPVWRIPGYAFNIGVKLAEGNVIVLTSPDIFHLNDNNIVLLTDSLIGKTKIINHPIAVKDDVLSEVLNHLIANKGKLSSTHDYDKMHTLKVRYPFCIALSKADYMEIGGFDEDFTGNCFDDADLYERLKLNNNKYIEHANVKVVHLYHPRHNYQSEEVSKAWNFNKKLWEDRKGIIVRNKDKEWGIL